jgi:hypothetical protein
MLPLPPQLHLSAPCGMCVWGMVQDSQWVCGCRHMSLCISGAPQSMPSCHKGAAPTLGTHLREGTSEVVGARGVGALKAAASSCVLGEWQRGEQAHQLVVGQVPAAGVREEGAGGGAGGRWLAVSGVLQQGLAGHTAHHPPPPSSYRLISFVIVDSVTGTVPTMLLSYKSLQCTAP